MNKMKNFLLLLMATFVSFPLFAAENEIQLWKKGTYTGSRTIECTINASLNEQILTVSFSDITASSIIVFEESAPESVLFYQVYSPAYSVQAVLTSLTPGDYVVEIYAFDEWWTGCFIIE